tara:strand:+ start:650 stop:913 length:264 start_codon:yes stop_codon:yes gene_type:complete
MPTKKTQNTQEDATDLWINKTLKELQIQQDKYLPTIYKQDTQIFVLKTENDELKLQLEQMKGQVANLKRLRFAYQERQMMSAEDRRA